MNQIDRCISNNSCNRYLMLVININDEQKEVLELYFVNAYEKYLFQTLIYNYLVRF